MKASFKKSKSEAKLDISALINASAKVDPLTWVMLYRRLHGSAMTFDMNRHMNTEIYRAMNPKQQMRLLTRHRPYLMQPLCDRSENKVYEKGRQVGISELSLTEVLQFLDTHDGTKWVYCVPDDAEILTRRGWKRYDAVEKGDETLAIDPQTHVSKWEPIKALEVFDWEGILTNVGAFHCTPEHRWPVEARYTRSPKYGVLGGKRSVLRTHQLNQTHKVPRQSTFKHDGKPSLLSPRLAAVLGWVVTDGCQWMTGNKGNKTTVMMEVTQSQEKFLLEVERTLKNKRTNKRKQSNGDHCWRVLVRRADVNKLLAAGYKSKEDLPSIVTQLSPEAMRAMWDAMMLAEGCKSGPSLSSLFFAQNHGPVLDSFQILCALLGMHANVSKRGAYVSEAGSVRAFMKPVKRAVSKPRSYAGKVWCPQTASGTWYMRYRGNVVFTGNTFPREKQLIDFATTRIKPAFEETPRMKSIIGFPDQVMTKRISKSFLLLRSAWEANLGEGIDADGVTFDEKDRMKEGIEIAFKESLSSSKYGFMREVSTPSLPGRGVDASYQKSCQYEWFVKCTKCGEQQSIDYPDNIVQMKDIQVGVTELEEGTYEYRCKRTNCRGLLDRFQGSWVAKYPTRKHISGYWMPQTIAVWISATKVMQKRIDYKYPQLWTNYVLGRTSVGDSVMLTPSDFEQCSAGFVMYSSRPMKGFSRISIGIDWGHQNWVVVMGLAENGFKYVLAIMMFEDDDKNPLLSAKKAEEFIRFFHPDIIVADAGYGKDRNSYLLRKYPAEGHFYACYYNPSDARSRTFQPQWSDEGHRVLCDRTMTLKDICRAIKEREIGFPDYGDRMVRLLERHFLNLAVLKIEEDGEVFEVVDSTGDDHLAHATAYAELGLMKEEGGGACDLDF